MLNFFEPNNFIENPHFKQEPSLMIEQNELQKKVRESQHALLDSSEGRII
jgi:hypothetical protein